jgi:hypothetical protein
MISPFFGSIRRLRQSNYSWHYLARQRLICMLHLVQDQQQTSIPGLGQAAGGSTPGAGILFQVRYSVMFWITANTNIYKTVRHLGGLGGYECSNWKCSYIFNLAAIWFVILLQLLPLTSMTPGSSGTSCLLNTTSIRPIRN